MANRVALGKLPDGSFGLRVSRPGADVLDPSLPGNQLAFDSRWAASSRIHLRGTRTVPASGSVTVNFTKTFSAPPVVLCLITDGTNHYPAGQNTNAFVDLSGSGASDVNAGLDPFRGNPAVRVYTNRLVLMRPFPTPVSTVFYFIVLDE